MIYPLKNKNDMELSFIITDNISKIFLILVIRRDKYNYNRDLYNCNVYKYKDMNYIYLLCKKYNLPDDIMTFIFDKYTYNNFNYCNINNIIKSNIRAQLYYKNTKYNSIISNITENKSYTLEKYKYKLLFEYYFIEIINDICNRLNTNH